MFQKQVRPVASAGPSLQTTFGPNLLEGWRVMLWAWLALSPSWAANPPPAGHVSGTIVEKANGHPVPYVTVTAKSASGQVAGTAATDAKGTFTIDRLPVGTFDVTYAALGGDVLGSLQFTLDGAHLKRDLGRIEVVPAVTTLERVSVSARRDAFYNSIDRKVYNVGSSRVDLQACKLEYSIVSPK